MLKSHLLMKVTILGCGTSTGVPVIGCKCNVCQSKDKKNQRTRASVLVSIDGQNLLIDTPPDFRFQALENNVERVDAVIFTHDHADHIFGLDEIRSFNFSQDGAIPIYATKKVMTRIQTLFDYIWNPEAPLGGGKPMLEANVINGGFERAGVKVQPIEIMHGGQAISGYRIQNFAYLTDCSGIPDKSREKLHGLELLILGALRFRPHPTHFSLEEALDEIRKINPKRAVLTHLSHSFDYNELNSTLPQGIELAYDGMIIEV
jgi:phosphoribosyl 1,2-cyclic phosphate phosphodiesterase